MKKNLLILALLFLLCGVSSLFAQKNVLFVSGSGIVNAVPSDTLIVYYLTKSGYTVTHIDDNTSLANIATDTIGKKIIIISSTVASGQINHVGYAWSPKPIINWENAADDEYGISAASNNSAELTFSININDNAHPMLKGLPKGQVAITTGDPALSYALPKNPVNIFATYASDATKSAWSMWEIGDDLDPALSAKTGFPADAKSVGRRCHVPFQNGTFVNITPEGLTVFLNSVDYMIDKKMDTQVPIVKLSFNTTTDNLNAGDKVEKIAIVFPSNATETVTWTSSNNAVATVSATGLISAISAGTATITATSNNNIKATSTITVTSATTVDVTGVTFDISTKSLTVGETVTLTASVLPTDATNKTLTWTSSNDVVATVSASGLVTAKSIGTATITATSNNGKTATAAITVTPRTGNSTISLANITVYPNPVKDLLRVKAEDVNSVIIYNVLGSQVLIANKGIDGGINVSGLKAGIYFIYVSSSKGSTTTKFIKE